MSNDFYKKPSFIASGVIILSCLFLSLFKVAFFSNTVSVSSFQTITKGASFSESRAGLSAEQSARRAEGFWKGAEAAGIGIIDNLSILMVVFAGAIMFAAWKGNNGILNEQNIRIAKISLLVLSAFFVVRYAIGLGITGGGDVVSVGTGLWLTLLASIFIFFEDKIMAAVNANMKK
jgi:hypothetical protein